MDYNDIVYFSAIVEGKGLSVAERKLGVSKSTLSRRLSALEERLGARLVQRNSRHLSLTRAGAVFYEHCLGMEQQMEKAVASVAMLGEKPAGLVRLSCRTLLAQYYMSTVLAGFMEEYPDIRVELHVTDNEVHPIESRMDIVVTTLPLKALPSDMIARKLVRDRYVLAASPGYIAKNGEPKRPEEIPAFQTVGEGGNAPGKQQQWTLTSGKGVTVRIEHAPRFVCADPRAQYHAAIRSAGIALLPFAFLHDAFTRQWLVRVLPDWAAHTETVRAVFPSQRDILPSVRALIEYLGKHLPAAMGLPEINRPTLVELVNTEEAAHKAVM